MALLFHELLTKNGDTIVGLAFGKDLCCSL